MASTTRHPSRVILSICLGLVVSLGPACDPGRMAPPSTPTPLATATLLCEQTLIPPQIVEIQPARPMPGDEITVMGYGGHIEDTCGGFIEGSREFTFYLDGEPAGSLSCYINRCEGKFTLPDTASTGTHCLTAGEAPLFEPAQCPFEFELIQE